MGRDRAQRGEKPRLGVVIPVRNGAALIQDCLTGVMAQAHDLGAEVVVVDDASTDGTADEARRVGATVVSLDAPSGPYVARNAGWRTTVADLLVFTDLRCRPDEGWLAALVAPFDEAEVAVTGGDVVMLSGRTVATRFAAERQPLRLATHYEDPYYLPAATTANMAVRRSILEAIGGFAEVRSGGDIDLCWRVQELGLGRVAAAYDATMTAVPRESARDLVRQWRRFGYGHLDMSLRHPQRGDPRPPMSSPALAVAFARSGLRTALRPRGSRRVGALDLVLLVAYQRAYSRAWNKHQEAAASVDQSPKTAAT